MASKIQVTNLSYTRRFNVAQYEHEEITVSVVPADGQSAEDLLTETRSFVEASRPKVNGAYITAEGAVVHEAKAAAKSAKTAAKPKASKKAAEPVTTDTVPVLFSALQSLADVTDLGSLEDQCNELADRLRLLRSVTPAADQDALKPLVDMLVEYKRKIDAGKAGA